MRGMRLLREFESDFLVGFLCCFVYIVFFLLACWLWFVFFCSDLLVCLSWFCYISPLLMLAISFLYTVPLRFGGKLDNFEHFWFTDLVAFGYRILDCFRMLTCCLLSAV